MRVALLIEIFRL